MDSLYSIVPLTWDPGVGCVHCTKHKGYIGKNKASLKNGSSKSRAVHSGAKAEAWAPNVWFKTRPSLATHGALQCLAHSLEYLFCGTHMEEKLGSFSLVYRHPSIPYIYNQLFFHKTFLKEIGIFSTNFLCWIPFLNRINSFFFIVSIGSGYLVYRRFRQDFMNFVYTLRFYSLMFYLPV